MRRSALLPDNDHVWTTDEARDAREAEAREALEETQVAREVREAREAREAQEVLDGQEARGVTTEQQASGVQIDYWPDDHFDVQPKSVVETYDEEREERADGAQLHHVDVVSM